MYICLFALGVNTHCAHYRLFHVLPFSMLHARLTCQCFSTLIRTSQRTQPWPKWTPSRCLTHFSKPKRQKRWEYNGKNRRMILQYLSMGIGVTEKLLVSRPCLLLDRHMSVKGADMSNKKRAQL